MFKQVDQRQDFIKLEHDVLALWEKEKTFDNLRKQLASSKKQFSFLDGPITANNPMGVHHAWGRALKDIFQRYKAMQGCNQRWQNGFDCQGLWVEVEVEKELKFKNKKDIEKYGIAKFVEQCKNRVHKYSEIQTEQSVRLGQWMDWENSYYTMSDENNYSIWHFLKTCHKNGYLYKGRDSVPWCPRCGTAISQHEILTEEYKELTHDSIYLELPIEGRNDERFLVWTTTPWTIPGNVALAVHPELEYWSVKGYTGIKFWIIGTLAKRIFGDKLEVVQKVQGKELVGLKYTGPFDEFPAVQAAKVENPKTFHSVVASKDLVNDEEGTGIVHIAPGAGTEDFQLGKEKDLPVIDVIDEEAYYLNSFGDLSGKNAKDDPRLILDHPALKIKVGDLAEDYIFEIAPYTHRYPTCWRCKDELVWRVVDEWYISMDKLRDKMMDVTKKINWIPEFGLSRELDWLKNMHDWLISKKRYWGLALPIWECECGHFEVIGSKEELKEKAVSGWKEFDGRAPHRPHVDAIKIKCEKCGKMASRIPDVGNPWLDAGIVPFSTIKYFENKKYWKKWFPPEFICESFPGQFKNWFYSLIVMGTVLENTNPFKTILGYATVKNERGEDMHKSKGNAIWFDEAAEKMGVDVMRWIYAKQNTTNNLLFGYALADTVRRKLLTLWNTYSFFVTYANIDKWKPKKGSAKPGHTLDKWILAELQSLIEVMTKGLDDYNASIAMNAADEFIEKLSNWYVRRSRRRFWKSQNDDDKENAYQTLYTVLTALCRLLAPILPFVTESIYRNLTGDKDGSSVHLENWPVAEKSLMNEDLKTRMQTLRDIVSFGLGIRADVGIKARQPLASLSFWSLNKFVPTDEEVEIIKEEVNVKDISALPNAPKDDPENKALQGDNNLVVLLDTKMTPELAEEGLVRDLIRHIQGLRKEADFQVTDRIHTALISDDASIKKAAKNHTDNIKAETLTEKLEEDMKGPDISKEIKLGGASVTIKLKRL